MSRTKTLKLVQEYQEDENTTKLFKVSKDTAAHFENWSAYVSQVDDTHIAVSTEETPHWAVLSDEMMCVGLNPDEFNFKDC
jgi:polyphosphate kinase 2 (PPK2 family)